MPDFSALAGPDVKPLQIEGLLLTAIVFPGAGLTRDFLAQPEE